MIKSKLVWTIFSFSLLFSLHSHAQKQKKMQRAIEVLEQSEFIKSYQECKLRVEKTATNFKLQEEFFEPIDIEKVKTSYGNSKTEFDLILDNMKRKLIDKKYRKLLTNHPEEYTELVTLKLELAMKNFEQNCIQLITEISGAEAVGFGLVEIKFLIKLVGGVFGSIKSISKQLDQMSDSYIEENFIGRYRIKSWEEL